VLLLCVQDGIIAAKRIDMSKKGVESCGDVDEVRAAGLLLLDANCAGIAGTRSAH
jgi:hypothetical protein